jgi:hypothetical protein
MLFCCGESAALPSDDGSIAAVRLGLGECCFGFGQPPEPKKRPGSAERSVAEPGSLRENEVVLTKRLRGIVTKERDSRETHAILEGVRVGHQAGTVRVFRVVHRTEPETDDPEGMPERRVLRRATNCLFEPRAGEFVLAPCSSAEPSLSGTRRITRGDLPGLVVEAKCLIVLVGELMSVTELDVSARACRTEALREPAGLGARFVEISRGAMDTDQEATGAMIVGMVPEAFGEKLLGVREATAIDEQNRLAVELGLARRARNGRRNGNGHERDENEPRRGHDGPDGIVAACARRKFAS